MIEVRYKLIDPHGNKMQTEYRTKYDAKKSLTHAKNLHPLESEVDARFKVFERMGWKIESVILTEKNIY